MTKSELLEKMYKTIKKVEKEMGAHKEGNWPLYCEVRQIIDLYKKVTK